jgi:pyruvate dehydrogenase E2 component (dihydrolipoamide acetyltransferase)
MLQDIFVPDLGQDAKVAIIEISVKVGDLLAADTTILTLESDKASMDLPMPVAGSIVEILVKKGDKVATGDKIGVIEVTADGIKNIPAPQSAIAVKDAVPERVNVTRSNVDAIAYAGPGARKFARELGVEINNITGTGRKQRIVKDDVKVHVQALLAGKRPASNSLGLDLPTMPKVDFSKYGAIETLELSKIKKLSGSYLHRNWLNIPHVTQFDVADITELEDFRQSQKVIAEKYGVKMTPIVFIMKAVIAALQQFPSFNASLDTQKEQLIIKKYYHVGIAVDTLNGLVVPVIRNVEQKGLLDLAKELAEISLKARENKLSSNDLQGGCFTISSLGGIGGTNFTPIINAPEVAILGVSKASIQPVYLGGTFVPRLILPLALSYDHRVIDGAEAAKFTRFLTAKLNDIRELLL